MGREARDVSVFQIMYEKLFFWTQWNMEISFKNRNFQNRNRDQWFFTFTSSLYQEILASRMRSARYLYVRDIGIKSFLINLVCYLILVSIYTLLCLYPILYWNKVNEGDKKRTILRNVSVGVRGWLEWWDGARAPWSSGRPVSGPTPQPPPPSISTPLQPASQRAASLAMEASQQQKEKEPRIHRPYAFDKVHSFLARK